MPARIEGCSNERRCEAHLLVDCDISKGGGDDQRCEAHLLDEANSSRGCCLQLALQGLLRAGTLSLGLFFHLLRHTPARLTHCWPQFFLSGDMQGFSSRYRLTISGLVSSSTLIISCCCCMYTGKFYFAVSFDCLGWNVWICMTIVCYIHFSLLFCAYMSNTGCCCEMFYLLITWIFFVKFWLTMPVSEFNFS